MTATARQGKRRFCLVLVKPSHYDDDGYVIQWLRSAIPSNSLAALYGLAKDCAQTHALGEDVEIEMHAFDETNTRIRPDRYVRMIENAGSGMVMLVGVQSNQFPRAPRGGVWRQIGHALDLNCGAARQRFPATSKKARHRLQIRSSHDSDRPTGEATILPRAGKAVAL